MACAALRAIVFDLDNTLIDFMKMKKRSCEAAIDAMRENGLDMPRDEALEVLYNLYEEHGWEHQKIFQVFLKKVIDRVDYRIMAAGIVSYRKVKADMLYSYSGVPSTLDELGEDYKLVILSDAPKLQAWTRLCAMELQDKFDHVITFDETGERKPSEEPFLLALEKLDLEPREVMMVGDSIQRDLKTAKELGMKTVLAKYGQLEEEEGEADWEIDEFGELKEVVKKIEE